MTIKFYRSTDASAPTLNGTVGSMITVLDACLVNGYGAKTAAGWTKEYSGTNTAAYKRPIASTANPYYLYVNDNGIGAGGARESLVRSYESMSSITVGISPCPTLVQHTNGLAWRKSSTLDATASTWDVIADDFMVIMVVYTAYGATATTHTNMELFGWQDAKDMQNAQDVFCTLITGMSAENTTTASIRSNIIRTAAIVGSGVLATVPTFTYVQRGFYGISKSRPIFLYMADAHRFGTSGLSISGGDNYSAIFPNKANNKIYLTKYDLMDYEDAVVILRATVRGFIPTLSWHTSLLNYYTHGDIVNIDGNDHLFLRSSANTPTGCFFIQTEGLS